MDVLKCLEKDCHEPALPDSNYCKDHEDRHGMCKVKPEDDSDKTKDF
jgi:hypothetical protein